MNLGNYDRIKLTILQMIMEGLMIQSGTWDHAVRLWQFSWAESWKNHKEVASWKESFPMILSQEIYFLSKYREKLISCIG